MMKTIILQIDSYSGQLFHPSSFPIAADLLRSRADPLRFSADVWSV